jgi:DNA replication protein DnaC
LDKYKKMPILCNQDLGAELKESLHMGNRINVLKQLIEYRGDRQDLITLITSNYPIDSEFISVKYGDRVVSRLIEMCNYFELKGKDRRIN